MVDKLETRATTQFDALSSWVKNDYRGTIVLATGFGKTRIGIVASAQQILNGTIKSCLVITPTIPLLNQWKQEYAKWGYTTEGIEFMCVKSAYKLSKHYDLIIVDEIHTSLSEKYRSVFLNLSYSQILGLTATKPHNEEYLRFMNLVCPIIYSKGIEDALKTRSISNYVVYNLEVKLNRSESARYRLFDGNLKKAQYDIGILKKYFPHLKNTDIFNIAKEYSSKKATNESEKGLIKAAKAFWSSMSLRKWICYESESKIIYIVDILSKFSNRKWIIFNKSIKFANKISEHLDRLGILNKVYHSKLSTQDRELALSEFESNKFRILIAVDALNAGLNVPDTDSGICVSGVSTELTNTQQLGRLSRRTSEDKVALFINLYAGNTVEENWVRSKTDKLKNVTWVTSTRNINETNFSK